MQEFNTTAIELFRYLLPGFITVCLFYTFSPLTRPSAFNTVVQSVIFSVVIRIFMAKIGAGGLWLSLVIAFYFAVSWLVIANYDLAHRFLRSINLSTETGYPSEWYSLFKNSKQYPWITLHTRDGKRIRGWLQHWPSDQKRGCYSLRESEYINNDNTTVQTHAEYLVVGVDDVLFFELQKEVA